MAKPASGPGKAMMGRVSDWLRGFMPAPVSVSLAERLRGCCGALLGLLLTGLVSRGTMGGMAAPMLIAPMGASAVLLFAVPASPLAQPWSILGGNIVSALIGVTCARWIADPFLAAPVAAALAIGAMLALRCLHPPSGAVALTAVLGGPAVTAAGYDFVLTPVGLNSVLLTLVAIAFNNATRRPYPHAPRANPHHTADPRPTERLGVSAADLDAILQQHDQILAVGREELEELFQRAEMRAYHRRFGEITCADIMSRDVAAVQADTPLMEAWSLLRRHDIRALPVVDATHRVVGMVSDTDFMAAAGFVTGREPEGRRRRGLRAVPAGRAAVVGQIMPAGLRSVPEGMPLAALVPLMADAGLRQVPVVDAEQRLRGIIAQSDLIAALYQSGLVAGDAGMGRQAA
ncbi:MAG TPA: HPP family protein [Roseomonas sp.]|nr:HPP family protein [Roseomonas sp.]